MKEDNRCQRKIETFVPNKKHKGEQGGGDHLKGEGEGMKEEEREEDATLTPGEAEEDDWVDINLQGREAIGRGTEGTKSPKHSLWRHTPSKDTGRLKGRKGRGTWLGRKEDIIKGRIQSKTKRGRGQKTIKSRVAILGRNGRRTQGLDQGLNTSDHCVTL